ncbi:MAG: regulatory signaling modulator protein AmpE [Proteobacteria bacterium]|nr:regulatory signaling modulator protein AmpE [Pseudomonadota bacterium]
MNFIAMIFALVLLQVWGSASRVHQDDWVRRLQTFATDLGMSRFVGFVFSIAAPVLLVHLLLNALQPLLFGLLWIAAAVLILLYSFGRGDFQALLGRYRNYCQSENFESAYLDAQSELFYEPGEEGPASPQEFQQQIQRCLLYEAYQRWFAVLFYFVLIGPEGALAYRLLQLCVHGSEEEMTKRVLFYADWVPARLLAATFTLAGDFIRSSDVFIASFKESTETAASILLVTARAALGAQGADDVESENGFGDVAGSQLAEMEALLTRSATSWLVIISVLVLLL